MTLNLGIGVNIIGVKQARDKLGRFSTRMATEEITDAIRDVASQALVRMKHDMRATWRSGEGSRRLEESLAISVSSDEGGNARVQFTLGNFRELQFLSSIGGRYHPGPYEIVARRKTLRFYWKRAGQIVHPSRVTHPGFPVDVIVNSGVREAQFLADAARRRFYVITTETFQES